MPVRIPLPPILVTCLEGPKSSLIRFCLVLEWCGKVEQILKGSNQVWKVLEEY